MDDIVDKPHDSPWEMAHFEQCSPKVTVMPAERKMGSFFLFLSLSPYFYFRAILPAMRFLSSQLLFLPSLSNPFHALLFPFFGSSLLSSSSPPEIISPVGFTNIPLLLTWGDQCYHCPLMLSQSALTFLKALSDVMIMIMTIANAYIVLTFAACYRKRLTCIHSLRPNKSPLKQVLFLSSFCWRGN